MSSLHETHGWDNFAKTYRSRTILSDAKMPGHLHNLLTRANDYGSFSSATSILDNGCGPGIVMERLIQNYASSIPSTCTLHCADFSAGMIAQVQDRKDQIHENGQSLEGECWARVQPSVQNAMSLDFPDSSQSHILASMVYFLTPDPFACLASSFRALKPDGILATSGLEKSEWVHAMEAGRQAVRPSSNEGKVVIPVEWLDAKLLEGEWEKAGFRDVTVESVEMEIPFESYDKQIGLLGEMPHVRSFKEGLSGEEREKWAKTVEEKMREFAPEEPGVLKGSVLVVVGRK